ncbi:MAG: glycosyltransferase, partial [Nitrososphaerota archaeon]|nr:glycosyltransferase [Nitrososphaerota archaeon]
MTIDGCGHIKLEWSKNPGYLFQIARTIRQEDPDTVHLQYEVNMFGGILTALMFPWLILTLRIQRFKTVVTIHSIVTREAVDEDFVSFFKSYFSMVTPAMMKLFYCYSNMLISTFSNRIIVHTSMMKQILCCEYRVPESKVQVIPIGIPTREPSLTKKQNYFFYFGYIARRKGLELVIRGFKKFIERNPNT